MIGHKICFYGEIQIINPKLSCLPLLIWSTALGTTEIDGLPGTSGVEQIVVVVGPECYLSQIGKSPTN